MFRQIKAVCDPSDAASFEKEGIEVHLSASDEQKWEYLRGLDAGPILRLWRGG